MMRLVFVSVLLAVLAACSHGGDSPYGVPFCGADVVACAGFPTKDSLDSVHVVEAACTDTNATLGCQFDTVKTYAYAVCTSCGSQDWRTAVLYTENPDTLASVGVNLCSPLRVRTGAYCATCSDIVLSMEYGFAPASSGGFASSVVCVADCAACEISP